MDGRVSGGGGGVGELGAQSEIMEKASDNYVLHKLGYTTAARLTPLSQLKWFTWQRGGV